MSGHKAFQMEHDRAICPATKNAAMYEYKLFFIGTDIKKHCISTESDSLSELCLVHIHFIILLSQAHL